MLPFLFLALLIVPPSLHPASTDGLKAAYSARDAFARQFAEDIKRDGYEFPVVAWKSGCKAFVCLGHGDHAALRVWMKGRSSDTVDRFAAQEIAPRMERMRELGFLEVSAVQLEHSERYPYGVAVIPVP